MVLFVPSLYAFLWFSVFGTAGIAMAREADNLGLEEGDSWGHSEIGSHKVYPIGRFDEEKRAETWFRVLEQFGDVGDTLFWVLSIIGIALYFISALSPIQSLAKKNREGASSLTA